MEFTLTATIFSFFGWNVYLLIKKFRERQRQNYLQNLIDQESDYLIMNVAPYKKIKVNEDKQAIIKPIYIEDVSSSSDDFELISYRRRKTILEEVKQENFQEKTYIENTKSFDMLPVPSKNDEFSFTKKNLENKELKRLRKNSKTNIDDSLPIDSPKQVNQNSSNKVSEKKVTLFESSNLKYQVETKDSKQESYNGITSLVTQVEYIQDAQVFEENKNISQLFPIQVQNQNEETKEQNNQLLGESQNIFGKFIVLSKPQEQQEQQQKQSSPQTLKQQQQPLQNNNGLFSNQLKTNNVNELLQFQSNQMAQIQTQNQNNGFQLINNQQQQSSQQIQPQSQQPQQEEQQQQQISQFQNIIQTNQTQIIDFNLDNQNQDNINLNGCNDSKIIQNKLPSNFTFGINQSNQTNFQGGLFDSFIKKKDEQFGNITTTSNIIQDQTSNKQNMCLQQSQQHQSHLIQSSPNLGTSLTGDILSTQQPKEQIQQSQTGWLFNFSSNTQTGCNLFSNFQKN